MRHDEELDPELEAVLAEARKTIVAPGSSVAVNKDAPVVTGDPAMDTQLENMRRILCARVWSMYSVVLRAKSIRLWEIKRKEGDHAFPPSLIKRDDHPLIQSLIEKAKELALINSISCEKRGEDGEMYLDAALQLKQSELRMRCTDGIDSLIKHIEKLGQEAMNQAKDLVKSFHSMAQAFRIHRDKMDAAGMDVSDSELVRIASQAKAPGGSLETFLAP